MSTYEPRFDLNLRYGQRGEQRVRAVLDSLAYGDGRVEVKRKSYVDLCFYVEEQHDPGRRGQYVSSGISVTTAQMWAYAIADTEIVLFLPTSLLRIARHHPSARDKAEDDGSCPTRGRLVHLAAMLDAYAYPERCTHGARHRGR